MATQNYTPPMVLGHSILRTYGFLRTRRLSFQIMMAQTIRAGESEKKEKR